MSGALKTAHPCLLLRTPANFNAFTHDGVYFSHERVVSKGGPNSPDVRDHRTTKESIKSRTETRHETHATAMQTNVVAAKKSKLTAMPTTVRLP